MIIFYIGLKNSGYFYRQLECHKLTTNGTRGGQSDLTKTAPNDPAHTARASELSRVKDRLIDRLTDPQTDTSIISCNTLQSASHALDAA